MQLCSVVIGTLLIPRWCWWWWCGRFPAKELYFSGFYHWRYEPFCTYSICTRCPFYGWL